MHIYIYIKKKKKTLPNPRAQFPQETTEWSTTTKLQHYIPQIFNISPLKQPNQTPWFIL